MILSRVRRVFEAAVFTIAAAAVATGSAAAVELEQILANFDRVQGSIETLSAEFTETTRSTLLKDEIVAEGKVFLTKPASVRWEYSSPETMRFVIADDRYLGYFPERKQAERRDIKRWSDQLFRFLGIGQASDELSKFYRISLDASAPAEDGTVLLILDPRKRRVRKRMESVRFWVDDETWLPVRVEYATSSGSTRRVDFVEMSVNPELSASLYEVDLPPDVEVTKGFSALSGFGKSSDE